MLVDFHHELINPHSEDIHIHDFSEWIKRYGCTADKFYVYFLAFFLRNGVLFENFQITPEEKDFTIKNVLPAFKTLVEIFGLKPLVVKLLPGETADHKHWVSYPKKIIENT